MTKTMYPEEVYRVWSEWDLGLTADVFLTEDLAWARAEIEYGGLFDFVGADALSFEDAVKQRLICVESVTFNVE